LVCHFLYERYFAPYIKKSHIRRAKLIREDTTEKYRKLFITSTISCSLKNIRNNNEKFNVLTITLFNAFTAI